MLVITRKLGETININYNTTVTVLAVKGEQVRIGVDAPRNIAVHREEVKKRIGESNSTKIYSLADKR